MVGRMGASFIALVGLLLLPLCVMNVDWCCSGRCCEEGDEAERAVMGLGPDPPPPPPIMGLPEEATVDGCIEEEEDAVEVMFIVIPPVDARRVCMKGLMPPPPPLPLGIAATP